MKTNALEKARAALLAELKEMTGLVAKAKTATTLNELTFKLVSKKTDCLIETALAEEID